MSATPAPGDAFNPFLLFNGVWLPNGLLERTDLSPGAKLAYARLCQFAGRDGRAYPSIATLGRKIGIKQSRARELVAELEKAKLIARRPAPGKTNRFVFLWQEWIGTPRRDPGGATESRRGGHRDSGGEETQGRDSPPEAAPLGGTPHNNGSLFAEPEQEISHDHASTKPRRGKRLDADWQPPAEAWDFGRSLGLDEREVADELDRFRDYWIAKPGKDGRKLDWCATFRNWLRRTADDRGRGPGHAGGSRGRRDRPGPASVFAAVNRILD
jgi:hypothetical protein